MIFYMQKRKAPNHKVKCFLCCHLPIFPGRYQPSIVGATELNCRVREGNGCTLTAIDTNFGVNRAYPIRLKARLFHAFRRFVFERRKPFFILSHQKPSQNPSLLGRRIFGEKVFRTIKEDAQQILTDLWAIRRWMDENNPPKIGLDMLCPLPRIIPWKLNKVNKFVCEANPPSPLHHGSGFVIQTCLSGQALGLLVLPSWKCHHSYTRSLSTR